MPVARWQAAIIRTDGRRGVMVKVTAAKLGLTEGQVKHARHKSGITRPKVKALGYAFGVALPPEMAIRVRANLDGRSISAYVRSLIEADLEKAQLARPTNARAADVKINRADARDSR